MSGNSGQNWHDNEIELDRGLIPGSIAWRKRFRRERRKRHIRMYGIALLKCLPMIAVTITSRYVGEAHRTIGAILMLVGWWATVALVYEPWKWWGRE